ncbi:hypothetical protein [uncultured Prevotella sp.]|uniref:hypothetical protein n=1 Tax=uncultured Prevotella sp. TaxID=159272 RepID=UPI0025EA4071|nr:hypothetical protein [uncultured Prevotella sp.]
MIASIFKNNDFTLCHVPVPKGYPQSQTHAGVAMHDGLFYLTTSPYPSIRRSKFCAYLRAVINKLTFYKLLDNRPSDSFENPCIYVGVNDGAFPPTQFVPLTSNPLMGTPDNFYGLPSFNSDPDIYIENDDVYVLNRAVLRRPVYSGGLNFDCRLFLIKGKLVDNKYRYMGTTVLLDDVICGSPSLVKYKNEYQLFSVESSCYNTGSKKYSISKMSSDSIEGFNNTNKWENVSVDIEGFTPWHLSVFSYQDALYAIVACVKHGEKQRCWQMLGKFNEDLSGLKIYNIPLSDFNSYRGAALVDKKGEFILYNTTVAERIKGSKSVDGRDVVMAHKPLMDILNTLVNNER